jgi:hypothetical protein
LRTSEDEQGTFFLSFFKWLQKNPLHIFSLLLVLKSHSHNFWV